MDNVGRDKKPKEKVKFPCKLCGGDHITYLFPHIEYSLNYITHSLAVLTNPFPHNKNMASRTMDTGSSYSGNQNPLVLEGGYCCINMMLAANVVTHSKDYGSSQPNLGKELAPPEIMLHIDNPEAVPRIPKGVLKRS